MHRQLLNLPEPPTSQALDDARRSLAESQDHLDDLTARIAHAEAALAKIIADSKCAINEMKDQLAKLEDKVFQTKAYLSPIRRLPDELLREIFMWNFTDYPCCAWVLVSVCSTWRKLALSMPRLWSKIRLLTTQHSSADTIRLWLERSGDTCSLDIEIFLRVSKSSSESSSRTRRSSSPNTWQIPVSVHHHGPGHYIIPHPSHGTVSTATISPGSTTTIPILPPATTPIIAPPSPGQPDTWSASSPPPSERTPSVISRASMHWAHIVVFYLVEQMHRWERFVFRFDKQFTSMNALRSIVGDAPLLREFEVSSAEAIFYTEWPWLPCANPNALVVLPKLDTLTLQYTPFKWNSPMLSANLRTLNLRALPTNHLPLDRILQIISQNPNLSTLSLHIPGVLPAILPLAPTSLVSLKDLSIGGHYLLSQLVESLILPSLTSLTLDIEARDPVEDTILNLLTRSHNPPLLHLSVAYGNSPTSPSSAFYYGPGGIVISWGVLSELHHLETLRIGGTPLEPLLTALGPPDDDSGVLNWACPNLASLAMKNCHAHSEGISKLVSMVNARNPTTNNGGNSVAGQGVGATTVNGVAPVKLRQLELYDCAALGQDVIKWLKERIDEVVCTEPTYERFLLAPSYTNN